MAADGGPDASGSAWCNPFPIDRHFDNQNYLFADGHVKWIRWEKVLPSRLPNAAVASPDYCYGGTSTPSGSNYTFCVR